MESKKKKTAKKIAASARRTVGTVKKKVVDDGRLRERVSVAAKRGAGAARRGAGAAMALKDRISQNPWVRKTAGRTAETTRRLARLGMKRLQESNVKQRVSTAAKGAWERYPALEKLRQDVMHAFAMNDGEPAAGTARSGAAKRTVSKKAGSKKTGSKKTASRSAATRAKTTTRKKTASTKARKTGGTSKKAKKKVA